MTRSAHCWAGEPVKEALFADTALLRDVLLYHVLPGQVLAGQIPFDTHLATVRGGAFSINAHLQVTDARHRQAGIVATDIRADNGVIHVIDRVLLPH
ncbi:MAG: fasciclin domain-containing protein [Burkholderiaceae bacterium]